MSTAPPRINGIAKPSIPPNQTLYIGNLPTSKINKQDLRRALYCLFSTYGPVLDVVSRRTKDTRGVAHVVFRDSQLSSQAMRALQGTEIFGREMKIQYARGKSDVISRLDGSAKVPESKAQQATAAAAQQSIFTNPNAQLPDKIAETAPPSKTAAAPGANDGDKPAQGMKRGRDEEDEEDEDQPMDEDSGDAMEESDDE